MNENERLQILQMIQDHKISAEEGAQLLEVLGGVRSTERQLPRPGMRHSQGWFKVRVTDLFTNNPKATINIPLELVDWGMRLGARYTDEVAGVNISELRDLIRSGADGKLLEVIDEQGGEHVEIFVE